MFSTITFHAVGLLSWGGAAEIAPDELRVLLLDAAGIRTLLDQGLPAALRPGSSGRAPIIGILPDATGVADLASLRHARADLLDMLALARASGVRQLFDSASQQIAGLPYTDEALAAVGTAIHRHAYSILAAAPKMLAVDCDGTLWQGVCAEQGPQGVVVGPEEQEFHRFLLEQKRAGRLLALVSKNIHADVAAVFEERGDLPLRWSDFAAVRVGWGEKSVALRELAQELNIALDSIAFIDDNPVECAEVRAACGEVVVLQRPRFGVRRFLEAAWPLDLRPAVEGVLGEERTRLYQDEALRRAALQEAPSFADHLRSLAIRTTLRVALPAEQARLFELAQRTNQFNTGADRLSPEAVADSLAAGDLFAVAVADRFGDYGVSGAVFIERSGSEFVVSRMMLSCRVLGRGVEEAVFDAMVAVARGEGCSNLDVVFAATERNIPARRFLEFVAGQLGAVRRAGTDGTVIWRFALHELPCCPRLQARDPDPDQAHTGTSRRTAAPDWTALSRLTGDGAALAAALGLSAAVPSTSPATMDEEGVLRIAAEVLGTAVSRHDNLYALGADSLKIVRLLARLKSVLGIEIPIGDMLYRADVADLLALARVGGDQPAAADDAFFDQVKSLYEEDQPAR